MERFSIETREMGENEVSDVEPKSGTYAAAVAKV